MYLVMFFSDSMGYMRDVDMRVFDDRDKAEKYAKKATKKYAKALGMTLKELADEYGDFFDVLKIEKGD